MNWHLFNSLLSFVMASPRWKLKTLALEHLGISVVDILGYYVDIYIYIWYIYIYNICSVKVMSGWWNISDEIGSMWMWISNLDDNFVDEFSSKRHRSQAQSATAAVPKDRSPGRITAKLCCCGTGGQLWNSRNQYGYIAVCGCCTCWYMLSLYVFASICITFLIPIWNILNDKQ